MSQLPISLSPDLRRLQEEGFVLEILGGFLLIREVPYVNAKREIRRGILAMPLAVAGDVAVPPADHVARWSGEHPCHHDGTKLTKIENSSNRDEIFPGFFVEHTFSAKPKGGSGKYADFHEKVWAYITRIAGPAEHLDSSVTARTHRVIEPTGANSVFMYIDTASSRANIATISAKLEVKKVAIVGLGGTGSYVLDLIAKAPVKEIHLYDKDHFLQHNAFRSPGAPSVDELRVIPLKVSYWRDRYSPMRHGIIAHEEAIDESNVDQLKDMNHVFICIDHGPTKKLIVDKLHSWKIPFIDVGMGIYKSRDALGGILRVTTSVPEKHDHLSKHLSFAEGDAEADYNQNIQIADLNALNAALAVIKWKKLAGFYIDLEKEHNSAYTIDGNTITNDDQV